MQALKNENITIYGEGQQTRSFCYCDDLIDGFIRMMNTADDITGPINIGNPNEFTIKQLAEQVIELTNSKSDIIYQPLPQDDPKQRCPDISKESRELDWKPHIELTEGLNNTIAYFSKLLEENPNL
jgi:UDP-glucuronate decarboxylase